MMILHQLAYWMDHIFAPVMVIDGLLFFKDGSESEKTLRERISRYPSLDVAQAFMNTVFLDRFITEVSGDDWESDDPAAQSILTIVRSAWSARVASDFPGVEFWIEDVIDDEVGDFGLCLRSSPTSR
jgi:hypothetical protein